MKIIVDAMGGDNAPEQIVLGAIDALCEDKQLEVTLVGDTDAICKVLAGKKYDDNRLEIIDAKDVITNDDSPTMAIKTKKESSLVKAFEALNRDDADGFVSAGSTGAVLVGAFMKVGRIKGVSRPALAPVLPTLKGNELTQEAYKLLSETRGINFVGNCEARDILSGDYDVVVCDGFNGNIALKSAEGTANTMLKLIKDGVYSGGLKSKLGALMLKSVFKNVKKKMDYNAHGGACFLGVNKIVVKSHGASKSKSITASILQAKSLAEAKVCDKIKSGITEVLAVQNAEESAN